MGNSMSSVVISGDTSGAITIAAPSVAGTNTATLPASTGTVMVSGNMPAFSAYLSSNQTPSNATYTKVQLNAELFDTANCFDSSTNYRFTPNVAGYYQVQGACRISSSVPTTYVWSIYKNGSNYAELNVSGTPAVYDSRTVSTLIYLNGSTDYIELYCYCNGTSSQTFNGGFNTTWLSGSLVRSA